MFAVKMGILQMRSAEVSLRAGVHVYKFGSLQEGQSDNCGDILHIVNIYWYILLV